MKRVSHSDHRGFTLDGDHPAGDGWRIDMLSVRWGKPGRGIHPNRYGLKLVLRSVLSS